ncbi:hypothetical protein LguiA_021021 [Lonicera macranthoides]
MKIIKKTKKKKREREREREREKPSIYTSPPPATIHPLHLRPPPPPSHSL